MAIVLFEDELVSQLDPVAVGKPAMTVRCGSYHLLELLGTLGHELHAFVRPHLRELVAADFANLSMQRPQVGKPVLLVNARAVPAVSNLRPLESLLAAGRPGIIRSGSAIAAALVVPTAATRWLGELPLDEFWEQFGLETLDFGLPLFEYPHDIIRYHLKSLPENLEYRIAKGSYREVADGVFSAADATLGAYVVTDTRKGPIVLERGATVGPHSLISGPAHLGAGARVIEQSAIKDGVALGHTTKIGGEVEASIIEAYTNKQHYGFLGHSYLGSWINMGAGTCNSDLKNTYGTVNMEYHGRRVSTEMQFIGAIIGDYSKTAINTGIFTGKVVGVCSMVYGFVTTNVPSFVNYARLFGQVTEAPVEVMVATQRRMFARRGVTQRPCDIQLLHDMYELTSAERRMMGETLSLEPLSL